MDVLRRALAVLIVVRSLTNFVKPFRDGSRFVVFGALMDGVWSDVVAPLFGAAMIVYAVGLWNARSWALPVAVAYALWATINVVLFPIVEGVPARWAPWMYVFFAVPGVAVPWLAVWTLRAGRSRSGAAPASIPPPGPA